MILSSPVQENEPIPYVLTDKAEKLDSVATSAEKNLTEATVLVLEARETKTGTVRAWCQFPENDDRKEAIFAKGKSGETLLATIRKLVAIKYNRLKENKTIFVIAAKTMKAKAE